MTKRRAPKRIVTQWDRQTAINVLTAGKYATPGNLRQQASGLYQWCLRNAPDLLPPGISVRSVAVRSGKRPLSPPLTPELAQVQAMHYPDAATLQRLHPFLHAFIACHHDPLVRALMPPDTGTPTTPDPFKKGRAQ